jgi:hypothetical protein
MGYDGTFTNHIYAPFSGTIDYASSSFSNWGGYVVLRADKPISGQPWTRLYFAEGITPDVGQGAHVNAGQAICSPAASVWNGISGNIEWGPAQSQSIDPLAKATADPKGMVMSFLSWAEQNLGVAPPSDLGNAGYP